MDGQLSYFLRLSSIIEAMPDALVIVDNNGRIILINGQTEHLFGYERTELLGKYVEQLMPERYRGKHTQHRNNYFVIPRVRSMGANLELFGMQKNGTEFPIEISLSPLKTEEGTFALAAVRDISIRKKAEAKFKSILEATPDCLIVINKTGKIILVNNCAEKLFGHATNEIVGQHVEFLIPKRFHNNHVGHRNNYFADPRVRPMGAGLDLYGQHKNGHEFPVEISLSPLDTEEGVLALAAVRDISNQKVLEEQLRTKNKELEQQNCLVQEANRLKSEFLANMSHELRTPLNGIIGFSEIMIDDEINPVFDEHKEFLNDILTSSQHLLRLINDMLDLAKIEAGKMEFYFEKIDLNKIINEVRDILRMLMAKKKIKLDIIIDEACSQLVIDPAKFKQILYNYISNAIKFSPEDGLITIKVYPDGKNNFRLDVIDLGIGISQQDQTHLFVEFQQLDSSVAKKYQGTGLGLALTRRIVEAQGGRVGVISKLHKGSTFYVVLPTCDCLDTKRLK